jgi:hypothetical protein
MQVAPEEAQGGFCNAPSSFLISFFLMLLFSCFGILQIICWATSVVVWPFDALDIREKCELCRRFGVVGTRTGAVGLVVARVNARLAVAFSPVTGLGFAGFALALAFFKEHDDV